MGSRTLYRFAGQWTRSSPFETLCCAKLLRMRERVGALDVTD